MLGKVVFIIAYNLLMHLSYHRKVMCLDVRTDSLRHATYIIIRPKMIFQTVGKYLNGLPVPGNECIDKLLFAKSLQKFVERHRMEVDKIDFTHWK